MKNVLGTVMAISASAVLGFGCAPDAPPSANSFTEVYARTIQPSCSNDYCHFNGVGIRFSALDLSSRSHAYWSLVGQPCMGPNCGNIGGMRVAAWQPDASVLYQKVSQDQPPCGTRMPADMTTFRTNGISSLNPGPALSAEEQQRIYNWIAEGAQDN
jgi:hypothetical protein